MYFRSLSGAPSSVDVEDLIQVRAQNSRPVNGGVRYATIIASLVR